MQFVESGKFFVARLIDKAGVDRESHCALNSTCKKYDDNYRLTIDYFDGSLNVSDSKMLVESVGKYFDENGVLCYKRFCADLKKIYDSLRLQTRKQQ
ncbi:unnamed protein product [Didymodactylos carnosus]|uniref:Signal peptidase complex subunit 2 n=1 Tax=Didymodactylos carnosus TaxID=1234261 RepID=A0A814QTV7_9BILA|nr:unnamed protein product [Didymodactylos carnosus]CAF1590520.1 unnamed protein product [Didymodactylos carnosus]CAF3887925.1 unnamed protein product [Didymodactylos carnosus]CAF4394163.1 unnamed protein product [Didymodactylos carnosus]